MNETLRDRYLDTLLALEASLPQSDAPEVEA